mmetsp:Transcript_8579/g.21802  ORF Transcript_8579/g.21802 Transcript_8579/m.21802 type:complete len:241 (-) Transcript_8579:87-809(-)
MNTRGCERTVQGPAVTCTHARTEDSVATKVDGRHRWHTPESATIALAIQCAAASCDSSTNNSMRTCFPAGSPQVSQQTSSTPPRTGSSRIAPTCRRGSCRRGLSNVRHPIGVQSVTKRFGPPEEPCATLSDDEADNSPLEGDRIKPRRGGGGDKSSSDSAWLSRGETPVRSSCCSSQSSLSTWIASWETSSASAADRLRCKVSGPRGDNSPGTESVSALLSELALLLLMPCPDSLSIAAA